MLLSLGVLVNYFDRVNLTVSHDAITTQFGISDFTFGLLLGAYNWTYAALQLPSGVLLDRFGIRLVGAVSTFLWSIASFAAALTRNARERGLLLDRARACADASTPPGPR